MVQNIHVAIVLDKKTQTLLYKQPTDLTWKKLGKLGAGPEEVEDITSFSYNSIKEQIYLYSRTSQVIMIYNLGGTLMSRKRVGIYAYDFEIIDKSMLVFYTNYASNKSKHLLVLYDVDKEVSMDFLKEYDAQEVVAWDITGFLSKGVNTVYFSPAFSDTIYCIKDFQYHPAYIMSITDERLSKIRKQHMKIYESQIVLDPDTSFQRNLFFEGLDFIILSRFANKTLDWGIYNTTSMKFNWVKEDNLIGIPFQFYAEPVFVDNRNFLWLKILPENIENYKREMKETLDVSPFFKDIVSGSYKMESANPLLVRCKINFE